MRCLLPGFLPLLHADGPVAPHDLWSAWPWEPALTAGLLAIAAAYGLGVRRLWRAAGSGRSVARWQTRCFAGGLTLVAVALLTPLDPLGETLFSAHMVQHLLLMTFAALLLVLGAPERALLWTLSPGGRRAAGAWWHRRHGMRMLAAALRQPAIPWLLSVGALIFWHLPRPFQAALANDGVHALEHLSFLGAGVLFWSVAFRQEGAHRLHPGLSVIFVFTAGLPGGLLGALLTFAGRPLYATQSAGASLWGLTPLEDQQLAGLTMWMPGALFYLGVAGWLFLGWLRAEERRLPAAIGATLAAVVPALGQACGGPDRQVPQGADSLQTAPPASAALESLPAGRAAAGSGFGAPIRNVDLSPLKPRLLNDVAVGPDGALYVTDTGIAFGPDGELQHPGPDRVFRVAIPLSSENRVELWTFPAAGGET